MKKCKKCGIEKPETAEYFVKDMGCKNGVKGECQVCYKARRKIYKKDYCQDNKESISIKKKIYRESNKEAILLSQSIYRESNREQLAANQRIYMIENKDKIDTYRIDNKESIALKASIYYKSRREQALIDGKLYYEANKPKMASYARIYRLEHRGIMAVISQRRRSKEKQLKSTLTVGQWNKICEEFGHKCAYCGESKPLTQDHLKPVSLGGEYTIENIICACKSCNSSKGPKLFNEWYPSFKHYCKDRESKIIDRFEMLSLTSTLHHITVDLI